ncbi:hypothetical protein [Paenibacillus durus]|uniref:DUF4241 domain-containing protein n=1 Tax=Paenibacillus durus ATCC 35681 TaxID=1333534 RepID=A0A0F7F904_PAEDU|nr:hypothetical protein [Paenibacillus durus]AKG34789.1 hypothetical protein VK70_09575 [Paenibacillus durus ATCC 35681]
MGSKLRITLDFPGIVIFDPVTLTDYLNEKKIATSDLITFFNENEEVGEEVIKRGAIIPMYPIPELDYNIFINLENKSDVPIPMEWKLFETQTFPLRVSSEVVIISDIEAIMDWEEEFYVNYENYLDERSTSNDYTKIPMGNYGVSITGYCEPNKGAEADYGYILNFQRGSELPTFIFTKSIDEYNFIVDPLRKK